MDVGIVAPTPADEVAASAQAVGLPIRAQLHPVPRSAEALERTPE